MKPIPHKIDIVPSFGAVYLHFGSNVRTIYKRITKRPLFTMVDTGIFFQLRHYHYLLLYYEAKQF